ncbi:hypothetical protein Vafri_21895 [Volvox africanus]|uniref:Uncharacterized protein n=1 Tax=Volvox africanus TaxID=51714 RepID=A0A8J4FFC0_9CHLO|nr:hypothetical protein Vafri_21895 [Volvox africanus]
MPVKVEQFSIGLFGSSFSHNGLSSVRSMQLANPAVGFGRMRARPQWENKNFSEEDINEDEVIKSSMQEPEVDAAYLRQHNVDRTSNITTVEVSVDRHTDGRQAEQFSNLLKFPLQNQSFVTSQAETPPLLAAATSATWSTAAAGRHFQQTPTIAAGDQVSPKFGSGFGLGPGLVLSPSFSSELDRTWNAACLSLPPPQQQQPSTGRQPPALQVHASSHHHLLSSQVPPSRSSAPLHQLMMGFTNMNNEGSTSTSSQSFSLMDLCPGSMGLLPDGLTSPGPVAKARRTGWDGSNLMEFSQQHRFPIHQRQQWPPLQSLLHQQSQQAVGQLQQQQEEAYLRKRRVMENLLMPLNSQQERFTTNHQQQLPPYHRHNHHHQNQPQIMQSETELSTYHAPSQEIINPGHCLRPPSPSTMAAALPPQRPLLLQQQRLLSPTTLMGTGSWEQAVAAPPPVCSLPSLLPRDHHLAAAGGPSPHPLPQLQQQQEPLHHQQISSRSNLLLHSPSPFQQQHSETFPQHSWQQQQQPQQQGDSSSLPERVSPQNIIALKMSVAGQQKQAQVIIQSQADNNTARLQVPSQQQQQPRPLVSPPPNAMMGSDDDGSSSFSAAFAVAALQHQNAAGGGGVGPQQWIVAASPPQQQPPVPPSSSSYQQQPQSQGGVQQTAQAADHLNLQERQLRNSLGVATTAGTAMISAIEYPMRDSCGGLGGCGVLNETQGHQRLAPATGGGTPSSVVSQGQGRSGTSGITQQPVPNNSEERPSSYHLQGPNSGVETATTTSAGGADEVARGKSPNASGAVVAAARDQSPQDVMQSRGGGITTSSADMVASPPIANCSSRGKRGAAAPRYPDRRRERLLGLQKRVIEQAEFIESLQARLKLLEEEAAAGGFTMSSRLAQPQDDDQQQEQ